MAISPEQRDATLDRIDAILAELKRIDGYSDIDWKHSEQLRTELRELTNLPWL